MDAQALSIDDALQDCQNGSDSGAHNILCWNVGSQHSVHQCPLIANQTHLLTILRYSKAEYVYDSSLTLVSNCRQAEDGVGLTIIIDTIYFSSKFSGEKAEPVNDCKTHKDPFICVQNITLALFTVKLHFSQTAMFVWLWTIDNFALALVTRSMHASSWHLNCLSLQAEGN